MNSEELAFLADLPLKLNSSFDLHVVIRTALEGLCSMLQAGAGSVFLSKPDGTLEFWALRGGAPQLEGVSIPKGKGIVGWVMAERRSVAVPDAKKDPRFYETVDRESGFVTCDLLCAPLVKQDQGAIGAIQILNSTTSRPLDASALPLLERAAAQLALAIDRAEAYRELSDRNRALILLDEKKNEMLTVLSHELRTPLSIMRTSAEMLTASTVSGEARDRMQHLLFRGIDRLTKLASQIRNLNATVERQIQLQRTRLAIDGLVLEVAEAFRAIVTARNLEIRIEISGGPLNVLGDPALLTVVVHNLISNAVRFTPDGGTITLRCHSKLGMARILVIDTGVGIAASQRPALFEKFFDVRPALEHISGEYAFNSGGLGLGLATVKAILELHDSAVQVTSSVGEGSTFEFALPLVH